MQYMPEGQYTGHVDYYNNEERYFGHSVTNFGGQRIATALLYLTTPEGGETVFRKSLRNNHVGEKSCAGKCAPSNSAPHPMLPYHCISCVRELHADAQSALLRQL